MVTDPQIGPRDPQIVTVQIRPADPPRSAFCRVPGLHHCDLDDLEQSNVRRTASNESRIVVVKPLHNLNTCQ